MRLIEIVEMSLHFFKTKLKKTIKNKQWIIFSICIFMKSNCDSDFSIQWIKN